MEIEKLEINEIIDYLCKDLTQKEHGYLKNYINNYIEKKINDNSIINKTYNVSLMSSEDIDKEVNQLLKAIDLYKKVEK